MEGISFYVISEGRFQRLLLYYVSVTSVDRGKVRLYNSVLKGGWR